MWLPPMRTMCSSFVPSEIAWPLGRLSSEAKSARKSRFKTSEMARRSSFTALQLGPRTLSGQELALAKVMGMR
jgi:hypothetical protein